MLHSGEWLVKKYASFAQPRGNQTLDTTLTTLAARLQGATGKEDGSSGSAPAPLPPLADRRAAILTIKGLARDHPAQVGDKALDAILASLVRDAREDDECARAVVETCLTLCEVGGSSAGHASPSKGKDGLPSHVAKHVDHFLASPGPLHALLPLLSPKRSFYTRFSSLQLLGTLLRVRAERVQEHVLTSPGGCGAILECLGEGSGSSAEIVRNEALLLLPRLVNSNADIQKLVAFEGAFEKLIDVVAVEGRIEGGVVVQDALEALVALLRYNVSNQNYFRETLSVPLLAPLLFYPPPPPQDNAQAVQEHEHQLEAFAFQQWYPTVAPADLDEGNTTSATPRDEQKVINAGLVLTVAGLLVEGQGESKRMNQNALLSCGFTQCVIELALASTAPATLRSHALQVLSALLYANRSNQDALNTLEVMPILQLPSEPGSETQEPNYTRLPPRPAIVELVGAAIHGISLAYSAADMLAFRASAMDCFDSFVNDNLDARLSVIRSMAKQSHAGEDAESFTAGSHIMKNVNQFPDEAMKPGSGQSLDPHRQLISAMMFAQLIRGSETAKSLARGLLFGPEGDIETLLEGPEGADGIGDTTRDEDDERTTLIQSLVGNLTMSLREHAEATRRERGVTATSKVQMHGGRGSPADWTRIQVGYLTLLITWLWDSPASVVEFLRESSNLQVLIQPVSQGGNMIDPIVSGLCAVVLGVVYEFGPPGDQAREDAGFVTRMTIHPILHTRIGPDQFAARLHRLRDDIRFKNTGPDVLENLASSHLIAPAVQPNGPQPTSSQEDAEPGLWFDWAFVDFLKTNYVQVQKSILIDPATSTANMAGQSTELIDAQRQLEHARDMHAKSLRDMEALQHRLEELDQLASSERARLTQSLDTAQQEAAELRSQLMAVQQSNDVSAREREGAATAATNAEINTLRDNLAALESRHKEEESRRQAAEQQLSTLKVDMDTANAALRDAEHARTRAEQEARDARARAETASAAVAAAQAAAASSASTPGAPPVLASLNGEDGDKSKEELEKELEDLLVLLDELSTKRRTDKKRMRQAGLDVSEDEDDEEEDEQLPEEEEEQVLGEPAVKVDHVHEDNGVAELEDAQKLFTDDPHASMHAESFPGF